MLRPTIHAELNDDHHSHVGRKRVVRLMRESGAKSVVAPRYVVTTVACAADALSDVWVERELQAGGPDQLWVAEVTYIPTWAGFMYPAVVLDVGSRKIVGWAMEDYLRTELVLAALDTALTQRRPSKVIHSDHVCQYTRYAFGKRVSKRT